MGDVIYFPGLTKLNIPAKRVLQRAIEADLDCVIVSGYTKDGDVYAASSLADGGNAIWLAEMFKKKLLEAADNVEQ